MPPNVRTLVNGILVKEKVRSKKIINLKVASLFSNNLPVFVLFWARYLKASRILSNYYEVEKGLRLQLMGLANRI